MARSKQRAKRKRFHGNRFGIRFTVAEAPVNLITVKNHIVR